MTHRQVDEIALETARQRRRWTETTAREVLAVYAASGQSMRSFASSTRLSLQRLLRWQRRCEQETRSGAFSATDQGVFLPMTLATSAQFDSGPAALVVEMSHEGLRVEISRTDHASSQWVSDLVRSLRAGHP